MTNKNAAISARILAFVAAGLTLPQAYDLVLGKGAYQALANQVHAALTSK